MQFPPPGHNDDFIEWSLGLIDETINFGSIPEIKKNKKNWKDFVLENFNDMIDDYEPKGSSISKKHFIDLVDTYVISKPLPRKLKITQDSFPIGSLSIEFSRKAYGLILKQRPDDFDLPVLRPLKKDWLEFWATLEKINFWQLGNNYFDETIMDGCWGDIHITYKNNKKVIEYNSDLPDTFEHLSKALRLLLDIPKREWELF